MATLHDLSHETLDNVINYLETLDDLFHFSLCCRSIHRIVHIAERKRYHRIRLTTYAHRKKAYGLLLDILRNPRLGLYIREMEISTPDIRDHWNFAWREIPEVTPDVWSSFIEDKQDIELILRTIRAAGFTDDETAWTLTAWKLLTWIQYFPRGGQLGVSDLAVAEAFSVAFMSVAPNLVTLQVNRFTSRSPVELFLKRANTTTPPFLRKLRHVRLLTYKRRQSRNRRYRQYDLLDVIRHFHRLPCIESLKISGIRPDPDGRETVVPRRSNFTKVHITHSYVGSSYLASIIRHSKALTEFAYTLTNSVAREFGHIYPGTLRRALLCHKSTLRMLKLDLDADIVQSDDDSSDSEDSEGEEYPALGVTVAESTQDHDRRPMATIGSLRDFSSMTELSIGVKLLLGSLDDGNHNWPRGSRLIDFLPLTLERLCIRGYIPHENAYHTDQITHLMENKDKHLPSLREVSGVTEHIPCAVHSVDLDDPTPYDFDREEYNEWASQPEEFWSSADSDEYSSDADWPGFEKPPP